MNAYYENDFNTVARRVNNVNGVIVGRDTVVAGKLSSLLNLGSSGEILDLGCGNGSFLHTFSSLMPGWGVTGYDVGDSLRGKVEEDSRVTFYSGPNGLDHLNGKLFDLITLNHVVEHLIEPVNVLSAAAKMLKPNGHIAIIIPCFKYVHADFFIMDHCSHYTEETLANTISLSGLTITSKIDGLSAIEIGFIAKKSEKNGAESTIRPADIEKIRDEALRCLSWAKGIPDFIIKNARPGSKVGIFGVGGTGMWLGAYMHDHIGFYVDDDVMKQELGFAGLPVLSVAAIPEGAQVFVPFNTPDSGLKMAERLKALCDKAVFIPIPKA